VRSRNSTPKEPATQRMMWSYCLGAPTRREHTPPPAVASRPRLLAATASAQSFSSQDTVAYATATIRIREQRRLQRRRSRFLVRARESVCITAPRVRVSIKLAGYALERYLTAKSHRRCHRPYAAVIQTDSRALTKNRDRLRCNRRLFAYANCCGGVRDRVLGGKRLC